MQSLSSRCRNVVLACAVLIAAALASVAPAAAQAPYIRYGSHGHGVWCVQFALNTALYNDLVEDGIDGPKTTAEIRTFQRMYGLTADGIVGPKTGAQFNWWFHRLVGGSKCYGSVPT